MSSTYDHRTLKTRLPVRSALFKQRTGGLVVRWVTTGESPLLYVFWILFCTHERSLDEAYELAFGEWNGVWRGRLWCEDAEGG
jgi:hypothetical protein